MGQAFAPHEGPESLLTCAPAARLAASPGAVGDAQAGPRPELRAQERSGTVKRAPFPLHPAAGVPVLTVANPGDAEALGGLTQGVR